MSRRGRRSWRLCGLVLWQAALLIAGLMLGATTVRADETQPTPPVPASAPAQDQAPAEPTAAATVEPPRGFGYLLGDVLTQRVLLAHEGRPLEPTALPPAGRVGAWLERREPRVEADAEGRRWLRIDYQFVNAPPEPATVALPALRLPTSAGLVLTAPEWPLSVSPLAPAGAASGAGAVSGVTALRPDRESVLPPRVPIERRLQATLVALAVVLGAWALWWATRSMAESHRLPFARAVRALRRLDGASPEAWQALHRAINLSAGRVVHAGSLERWLQAQPALRPLEAPLAAFFRRSAERFFDPAVAAPDADARTVQELARALRRVERAEHR